MLFFPLCHQFKSIYHECFGDILLVYALILKKIVFFVNYLYIFSILFCPVAFLTAIVLIFAAQADCKEDLSKRFMDEWFHKTERS